MSFGRHYFPCDLEEPVEMENSSEDGLSSPAAMSMPAMSMETPAKYLHLKGMPTVLPGELFPHELNQALMAKTETEVLAAGMCLACFQADCGRAPDLQAYQAKADFDDDSNNGKTDEQRQREMYVNMVDLMIMDELGHQLDNQSVSEDGEAK